MRLLALRSRHVNGYEYSGQLTLDFDENAQALQEVKSTIARIERTLQSMPQFILGHIYPENSV